MIRIFITSIIASLILTFICIHISRFFKVLDHPDSRKQHLRPTPLLGGLAVFLSYVLAVLVNYSFSWQLKGVVGASLVILLMGLIDDIHGLPAITRLLVQVLSSLIVVSFGVHLDIVPKSIPFAMVLDILITVVWIIGITNAMNFMDGMDGVAAGVSAIASATFFVVAYQNGQPYFAFLSLALMGSCMGFLVFNSNPAKIFLGDSGSSFLGFTLASLAVMGEWGKNKPLVALTVPILILAVPIFDVIYITVSRVYAGKVKNLRQWIEYVGRDHFHHRLLGLRFTEKQSVLFIYLICLIISLGALMLIKATERVAILLLIQAALLLVAISILMIVARRYAEESRLYHNLYQQNSQDGLAGRARTGGDD